MKIDDVEELRSQRRLAALAFLVPFPVSRLLHLLQAEFQRGVVDAGDDLMFAGEDGQACGVCLHDVGFLDSHSLANGSDG
eukprot:m.218643 g.218643  ORF g.218643 m.218643 type:complete len:80 (-) comp16994_c2_seq1:108-347(-)